MDEAFNLAEMKSLWEAVGEMVSAYQRDVAGLRVAPSLQPGALRSALKKIDFRQPKPWRDTLAWVDRHMREDQLHAGHPKYFGLFNPAPVPLGIAADALTAAYNPQLAAWSHSPFANELEAYLIGQFGAQFGLPADSIDGAFCSGGAEANHTALLCALNRHFPDFATGGIRALPGQPVFYISSLAHHSWVKAARACGLGSDAVRSVAADPYGRMDLTALKQMIREDIRANFAPFMICGTAGTTGYGTIDPLAELASLAREAGCWYHVDAAWGGAARFVPQYRDWLQGIESADSITFDAHKFLSIPMGAGVFLTRHKNALSAAFRVSTDYMPHDAEALPVVEPYAHSMQWSRRFIGLKVFLHLSVAGWDGLAKTIRHQCQLGGLLRELLTADGWECVNHTPLPVICFTLKDVDAGFDIEKIASFVVDSGRAWISTVTFNRTALRACITNFRTTEQDVIELVQLLHEARSSLQTAGVPPRYPSAPDET